MSQISPKYISNISHTYQTHLRHSWTIPKHTHKHFLVVDPQSISNVSKQTNKHMHLLFCLIEQLLRSILPTFVWNYCVADCKPKEASSGFQPWRSSQHLPANEELWSTVSERLGRPPIATMWRLTLVLSIWRPSNNKPTIKCTEIPPQGQLFIVKLREPLNQLRGGHFGCKKKKNKKNVNPVLVSSPNHKTTHGHGHGNGRGRTDGRTNGRTDGLHQNLEY